jgi:hypothetical protein
MGCIHCDQGWHLDMPLQLKLLSAPADAAVGYTADSSHGPQDEFLMDLVKVHVNVQNFEIS